MELHLNEIHDYLHCPTKYEFKHELNLKEEKSENTIIKEAVHKTIYYFFYALMGERLPTLKEAKDKYANIFSELQGTKKTKEDLLTTVQPFKKKSSDAQIKGYEMVHYFYHFNKENHGVPIGIDFTYRVPVDGINVTGNFELVREIVDNDTSNRFIEIVDFKTGNETLEPFIIRNDFNLTLASFAFRNLFNAQEDRLKYHYLRTGKEITTQRSLNDYKRMKTIVEGVAEGISKKHYYPRQSFMCRSCPFKTMCDRKKF